MVWKVFTGRGSKGDFSFPVVTVHRAGTIALNDRSMDALGEPEHIDFLFDEDEPHLVAFRANPDGAYAPRRSTDGKAWIVSAASLFRFLDRQPKGTYRYRASLQDDLLIIDLDDPIPPVRGVRPAPVTNGGEE